MLRESVSVGAIVAGVGGAVTMAFPVLIGRLKTEQSAQHWLGSLISELVALKASECSDV